MTTQMSEMQHEVDDKHKTETALKAAEQARKEVRQQAWAKQQITQQTSVLHCACMQAVYAGRQERHITVPVHASMWVQYSACAF